MVGIARPPTNERHTPLRTLGAPFTLLRMRSMVWFWTRLLVAALLAGSVSHATVQSEPEHTRETSRETLFEGPSEMCGLRGRNTGDLLRQVASDPSLSRTAQTEHLDFYVSPDELRQVAITRPGAESHPSVICREILKGADGIWVARGQSRCRAPQAICDVLLQELKPLHQEADKRWSNKQRTRAAPAPTGELVLPAEAPFIELKVNGVQLKLKVQFDHQNGIMLNAVAAARAGLGRGERKYIVEIGPVTIEGRRSLVTFTMRGATTKIPVAWMPRDVASDADGVISPHWLPVAAVRLQRKHPAEGEREFAVATRFELYHGIHVPITASGQRIAVSFTAARPRTYAMAAAAALIGAEHGGSFSGEKGLERISHGVSRPVRTMRLDRPLRIGPLEVSSLAVRSADFRGKHLLPAIPSEEVTGDITVTGVRLSQQPEYRVVVGLDVLESCSSITYEPPTNRLRFRCKILEG